MRAPFLCASFLSMNRTILRGFVRDRLNLRPIRQAQDFRQAQVSSRNNKRGTALNRSLFRTTQRAGRLANRRWLLLRPR